MAIGREITAAQARLADAMQRQIDLQARVVWIADQLIVLDGEIEATTADIAGYVELRGIV